MSNQDENEVIVESPTITDDQPISTVSHKRRVHFPTDESQLRIISITPEPLSNQPLLSLGVILQRYRATCQRLQIRPLNCLLDQLSTIDDTRKSFQDRLDCLRIINERLDLKHIDAIEEIFSRCRFQTLDFDSSFSDDLALVQLFDVIEYYETCTHLNLSNNRSIGVQGYQALTRYLRKTRYLERLDMNSIRFDDTSMLGFGRSLRLSSTLYELHVESCQLNGKILQKFIQNLRSCVCLRELYLCDNRLQIQDSILINELIRSCGQFLHVLDLRSNSLQDNGLSHIASQLSQFDENHTQQNSIYKISFQSNQLTHQGISFLAKSLLHNRTIRSLNLSYNQITNEGFYFLRDALLTNRTINELILRNCRLTDQAAIALAEYIAESSTIQYIDLRENQIQISGICGIAIAMKTNKSLLRFDIDPVLSTSINSNNNIDRTVTTQTNSLLSLTNLRRMTIGFGGLTNNSNGTNENIRELNEQKAKWLNDIECICQRNWILYEDEQRRKQKEIETNEKSSTTNGIEQEEIPSTTLIDNHFQEITTQNIPIENNQQVEPIVDISTTNENETQSLANENPEVQPLVDEEVDIQPTINENSQIQSSSTDQDTEVQPTTDKNTEIQPSNDQDTAVPPTSHENAEIQPSTDETIKVEQIDVDLIEPVSNGENHEEILPKIIDENSLSDSSPIIEDEEDDEKRKLRHSDSLYLLRKKINNDEENTSDDESEISSAIEPQPITNNA